MNRIEYENEFIGFKNQLASFLFRLITNRQDVEDLVQDTYIKAFKALDQFQKRSSFKTWVFSIGLNLAKNQLQKRQRWSEDTQEIVASLHVESQALLNDLKGVFQSSPEANFEIKEHIDYCFTCVGRTLKLEQEICFLLREIYHFKIAELMVITGLTEGKVKHALANARQNLIRIFDNKCAFVNKQGICHQCSTLHGILNPKQEAQVQLNQLQLVKSSTSNRAELLELRLAIVRDVDNLNGPGSVLHTYLLEHNPKWMELQK